MFINMYWELTERDCGRIGAKIFDGAQYLTRKDAEQGIIRSSPILRYITTIEAEVPDIADMVEEN